jgi:hypothetical protein
MPPLGRLAQLDPGRYLTKIIHGNSFTFKD